MNLDQRGKHGMSVREALTNVGRACSEHNQARQRELVLMQQGITREGELLNASLQTIMDAFAQQHAESKHEAEDDADADGDSPVPGSGDPAGHGGVPGEAGPDASESEPDNPSGDEQQAAND